VGDDLQDVYEFTYQRLLRAIKDEIDAVCHERGLAGDFYDVLSAAHATLAQEVGRLEKLLEEGAKLCGKRPPDLVKVRRERMARGRGLALHVMQNKGDN
jgi:hypothetical protein